MTRKVLRIVRATPYNFSTMIRSLRILRPTMASLLAVSVLCAVPAARAQGTKPAPWRPKDVPAASGAAGAADSAGGSEAGAAPPGERPVALPPDMRRLDNLVYQPNVPDTLLPFVPTWLDVPTVEKLSGYVGTLRQGSPERFFPIVLPDQTVHAEVDGGAHGSQIAVVLFIPWLGDFVLLPYTTAEVSLRMDDLPEQKQKLSFSPGPILFSQELPRPVPVSAPGSVTVPIPPGRHRLAVKLRDTRAVYVFLLLGQTQLAPLPVTRDS